MSAVPSSVFAQATAQRVDAALTALGETPANGVAERLARLVELARRAESTDAVWLLIIAVCGAFPRQDDVRAVRRVLDLVEGPRAVRRVLATLRPLIIECGGLERRLQILDHVVVVDVDFSATHEHNTGIQRVVRETMASWVGTRADVHLAAWTRASSALRAVSAAERDRVVDWGSPTRFRGAESSAADGDIVVPWRSDVVIVEVPSAASSERMAALAEFSGNRVHLVGYDTIPIVSADMLHPREAEKFASYLTLVKHSTSIVGISESAAQEFSGYISALRSQGVTGPQVSSCALPAELTAASEIVDDPADDRMLVLSVGSHEARKNHRALLFASEVLWREGFEFELALVGRGSAEYIGAFDAEIARMVARGRPITVRRDAGDEELAEFYRRARVMVFPSLHEGYGLPVAEALSRATPVITTAYGSTAEIARDGGCLVIDPRDDDSLVDALRSVLADDSLVERLRDEARRRPERTWKQYADELWAAMIQASPAGSAGGAA
ncbi:glycosyltransferase [Microcella humidisoli]|uniref:Glycosyltransferase n=1 Tax=Microcella humidisoli TaxID=2963406 RepID=A0ABY5FXI4_9MICO|nr:glycosyltransferase [Microcella humidisoli]UTT63009.1 glycosyltransferase [Microcella humidisoli]